MEGRSNSVGGDAPDVLGLYSRTLVRSPVIRWIYTARLRNIQRHEVAMVGDHFITVNEIDFEGRLRLVGTIDSFDSQIRSAGIVGTEAKYKPRIADPITGELQEDVPLPESVPPQFIVVALKDPPEMRFLIAKDQRNGSLTFHERIRPLPVMNSTLSQPGRLIAVDPESRVIAVAAAEQNLLVYRLKDLKVLAGEYMNDMSQWDPVHEECILQVNGTILRMDFLQLEAAYPNHVALVLIVAATHRLVIQWYIWDFCDDSVQISDLDAGPFTSPLPREYGPPHLLIPSQREPSFLMVYHKHYIIAKDAMTRRLSLTDPIDFRLGPKADEPRFPAASTRLPAWTSWAKQLSIAAWDQEGREKFYLVREDGVMCYFFVKNATTTQSDNMGSFEGYVDQAFACCDVDMSLMSPYYMISAGVMSPGQIKQIGKSHFPNSRYKSNTAETVDTIQNWSPTVDMIISDLSPSSNRAESEHRAAIYATARRGPNHGAVVEMNIGCEARSRTYFSDEQFDQLTGLWSMRDHFGGIFMILSFPLHSRLFNVPSDYSDLNIDFDEDNCGVTLDDPTIAAGVLPSGRVVQVSASRAHTLHSNGQTLKEYQIFDVNNQSSIVSASIHPSSGLALLAFHGSSTFFLRLIDADAPMDASSEDATRQVGDQFPLSTEPTAMALFECGGTLYAAVTTSDRKLHILQRSEALTLTLTTTHALQNNDGGQSTSVTICESLIVLHRSADATHETRTSSCALVCGMRDGTITHMQFTAPASNTDVNGLAKDGRLSAMSQSDDIPSMVVFRSSHTIGLTPVSMVVLDARLPTVAFASCGSRILRIVRTSCGSSLSFNEVITSLRLWPTTQEQPVRAISSILTQASAASPSEDVVIVNGDTIHITSVDSESQVVPSFLGITKSTPTRLLDCERLSAIILASTRIKLHRAGQPLNEDWRGRRRTYAQIEIISTTHPLDEEGKPLSLGKFRLWPGEKIYAMLDWRFKDFKGKKRGLLVIGTGLRGPDGTEKGRTIYLNVKKEDVSNSVDIVPTKVSEHRDPVYSIAEYSERELVITSGKIVRVLRMNFDSTNVPSWNKLCEHELRSAGIHVTTSPPFIYVSTAEDSLVVFKMTSTEDAIMRTPTGDAQAEMRTSPTEILEPMFADSQARDLLYHLPLSISLADTGTAGDAMDLDRPASVKPTEHPNVSLLSDKACRLSGLLLPSSPTGRFATRTLFEAQLPRSLMRIKRGAVRPPWRRPPRGSAGVDAVLADDIVGVSVDGTVYQFSIVDARAWRVLKMLENLAKFKELLRLEEAGRFVPDEIDDFDDEEGDNRCDQALSGGGGVDDKMQYHVDGDFLEKHVKSKHALERLLTAMGHERYGGPDATVFEQALRDLLGLPAGVGEGQAMEALHLWLVNITMPML